MLTRAVTERLVGFSIPLTLPGPSSTKTVSLNPVGAKRPSRAKRCRVNLQGVRSSIMQASYAPPTEKLLAESLGVIQSSPVVLCIRMNDPDIAFEAAVAAIRGGLRCIEVTMTTPDAPCIMRKLIETCPDAHVGAGTILTKSQADEALAAGAKFALSPVVDAEIIRYCNERGMLSVPGAATPTEVHSAFAGAGARLVKLFPVNLYGGVDFVRALRGPLGHVTLLPTSGIDLQSMGEYLKLDNVSAVGASRQILTKDAVERRDWDAVSSNAEQWASVASRNRVN